MLLSLYALIKPQHTSSQHVPTIPFLEIGIGEKILGGRGLIHGARGASFYGRLAQD